MPAAYDNYDYPSYWKNRKYEHESEVIALKELIQLVPKVNKIVDLGCGYGRLTPFYIHRGKNIILADPSARLLSTARKKIADSKVRFIQVKTENINRKIKSRSVDLVLFIRVLHHISDIEDTFKNINKLLSNGGYFILEFANKNHFKAFIKEAIKGNITYILEIFPKDIRSKKSIRNDCLPFVNYHPDDIIEKLGKAGFEILEKRSVSNIRWEFIKKRVPLEILKSVESKIQTVLSSINFGPSIFVLARKRG